MSVYNVTCLLMRSVNATLPHFLMISYNLLGLFTYLLTYVFTYLFIYILIYLQSVINSYLAY